ncbi:hypothetical protein FVQ98_06720 [Ottowia sp. GY511]|uniref:Uncharacterized protein n=1 Tax=Ottowia flava TaxID=2675430 RepID=A0ABW4KRY2_9BURK|nr:hypothetical protein [Ottowia sp. GY511]TXK30988.1 hypothetical protein FVQ98_06720 [Ottowia sp. GY511]
MPFTPPLTHWHAGERRPGACGQRDVNPGVARAAAVAGRPHSPSPAGCAATLHAIGRSERIATLAAARIAVLLAGWWR